MPSGPEATRARASLVEPEQERVLGLPWGGAAQPFLERHHAALLVRDRGDIRAYTVDAVIVCAGQPCNARVEFRLDALIAVTVELPASEPAEALL